MVFLMLENTRRPSRTAVTMVVKLSSVMTMSEALFVTSVPETPIAMPISAVRILGASLMPSPVIATTLSFFCKARTIHRLVFGADAREYFILRYGLEKRSSPPWRRSLRP